MVGDSAGGNLITGVTSQAILSGFRVPDGLLLVYPGLCLDYEYPTVATFLSFESRTLPYHLFNVIIKAYITANHSPKNHLLSAIYTPQYILERFPKVEMMIAMVDPCAGHCFGFAERLMVAGCDVHVNKYPFVEHAALNFGNKGSIGLYTKFVDDSAELIKKLLG